MQERPVLVETETDLADRFHPALADIRVLDDHVAISLAGSQVSGVGFIAC
jgi:hypothetical protein